MDLSNYKSLFLEFIRKNGKEYPELTQIFHIIGYYVLSIFYVLVTIQNKRGHTQPYLTLKKPL